MVSIEGVKFQYDAAGPVSELSRFFMCPGRPNAPVGQQRCRQNHLASPAVRTPDPHVRRVDGGFKSLHTSTDRELDRWRGTEVGVIFQQSHFVQSLTVRENLALPTN